MARQKSNSSDEDKFPLWFNLPRRFYERLTAAHEKFGVPRTKLLMRGLELAVQEEEAKRAGRASLEKKSPNEKRSGVPDEALSDALRRVAEMRWQAASEEERKEIGRKLAEARWGKKRTKKTPKS